jgi:nicotinate-nucleotide adenylyltransferase
MLQLLIEEIDNPRRNIILNEALSHRRSIISLQKAKEIWGDEADYTIVIGSDLLEQIRSWYRVKDLLEQVQILVVSRPGYTIENEDLEALQDLGGKWSIANLNAPAVSSTAYREQQDRNVLTKPVKDYICKEQLYA